MALISSWLTQKPRELRTETLTVAELQHTSENWAERGTQQRKRKISPGPAVSEELAVARLGIEKIQADSTKDPSDLQDSTGDDCLPTPKFAASGPLRYPQRVSL
ncbi:hypothetical protein KIL84_020663 [Mauremys mutica]|uniref:Uncharacterized protein n=1 Tax=Mauremys mutica TaxID=74926 RepID=A0A9D3X5X3_9SAUR|nr:hypothetical protein KIL84_020663 [Mauremys mutica]